MVYDARMMDASKEPSGCAQIVASTYVCILNTIVSNLITREIQNSIISIEN